MPCDFDSNRERTSSSICLILSLFVMDPDQQEALNGIQNSIYRTALKLCSVQTLCQLGLTDVSLIQHILPSHRCEKEKQSFLTRQQLSQLLRELFQNVRLDKPGQVDPRAPELTLNLLTTMYDRAGVGIIKARSAAAALIALSGDSLLTKYKALFQLYADPGGRRTLITQGAMRSLLTDLHQIPATVGESCALSCVEIAVRSCFHGLLNSAIDEEKFLTWLRSEPGLLLWLPTCYRLSATAMVTHNAKCRICKNFPITGLRYRCLKCLNFDLCQVCFFTERQSKPHKTTHPVMEYCVQMSAKENAKIFLRTVRNNLLPGRCRRKEDRRRQMLEMMEGGHFPEHEQVPSVELNASPHPVHHYQPSPVYSLIPGLPKHLAEKRSVLQLIENENRAPAQDRTSAQAITLITAELLKTRESIKALRSERRYLRKQLKKWKDKVQLLFNSQEDKTGRLEAKLQVLIANHESMKEELQQMKAMLQPPNHPSFLLCPNTMLTSEKPWEERKLHNGSDSALVKPIPTSYTEWKSLEPCSSSAENRQLLQTQTDSIAMNPRSGSTLGLICLQSGNSLTGQHEKSREKGIPRTAQVGVSQPEKARNLLHGVVTRAPSLTAVAVPFSKKEMNEEEELKQLMLKLKDALSLQLQPDQQSTIKKELLSTAEHVSRSFSDLINHITLPG